MSDGTFINGNRIVGTIASTHLPSDVAYLDVIQTWTAAQTFASSTFLLRNPANTFSYTIVPAAITAARNLSLPLITGADTLAALGLAQTWTAAQTFGSSLLKVNNPAGTFAYTIVGSAITAARNLTLPLVTAADTFAVLGLTQTFTGSITIQTASDSTAGFAVRNHLGAAVLSADTTNSYVGIGNVAPSVPLHIETAIDAMARFRTTDNTKYCGFEVYDAANTLAVSFQYANPGAYLGGNAWFGTRKAGEHTVLFAGGTTFRVLVDGTNGYTAVGPAGATAAAVAFEVQSTTGMRCTGPILSSYATGGIGYRTGAGGTVTQLTSKSTGVSLAKMSGAITMHNAALAADAIVSFVLTNAGIAATDVLVLNHISGGTPGAYTLNARCAAGSATIDVTNHSAGSLSEAIVIQFAVVKAVNA